MRECIMRCDRQRAKEERKKESTVGEASDPTIDAKKARGTQDRQT